MCITAKRVLGVLLIGTSWLGVSGSLGPLARATGCHKQFEVVTQDQEKADRNPVRDLIEDSLTRYVAKRVIGETLARYDHSITFSLAVRVAAVCEFRHQSFEEALTDLEPDQQTHDMLKRLLQDPVDCIREAISSAEKPVKNHSARIMLPIGMTVVFIRSSERPVPSLKRASVSHDSIEWNIPPQAVGSFAEHSGVSLTVVNMIEDLHAGAIAAGKEPVKPIDDLEAKVWIQYLQTCPDGDTDFSRGGLDIALRRLSFRMDDGRWVLSK